MHVCSFLTVSMALTHVYTSPLAVLAALGLPSQLDS